MEDRSDEILSINMKWKKAARYIAAALESGTPQGKRLATAELMRMADVADYASDIQEEICRLTESEQTEA